MRDIGRGTLAAWAVALALSLVAVSQFARDRDARSAPGERVTLAGPASHGRAASGPDRAPGGAATPGGPRRAYVHVAGAVRRPGLYTVPAGARVASAVDAAGGPLRRADVARVNLAAVLVDGQQVMIPERARAGEATPAHGRGAGPSRDEGPGRPAPDGATAQDAAAISLSTASQQELETLDGIGPALAGRIVAYRDAHGGFRSVEQLQEVEGIGPKRLDALRASVRP
jgi:competence protein ComEA